MWSYGLIVAPDIVSDSTLSLKDILIATLRHPFYLKTSKEALSGCVVPAITFSAHTLLHALTTRHRFSVCLASVMRSLIRMKYYIIRFKSGVIDGFR